MPISHKKPAGQAQGHRQQNLVALAAIPPRRPDPPTGMLKVSRDRWASFWSSRVALAVDLDSDLPRLERWIKQTDEYDRVAKICKRARLLKGSMKQPVLNPLFGYLAQLEAQISRAETEFGMTPMARLRLGIALNTAKKIASEAADAPPGDDGRRRRLLGDA